MSPAPRPERAETPAPPRAEPRGDQPKPPEAEPALPETASDAAPPRLTQPPPIRPAPKSERGRSEEYHDVKTTVFNALIDTIDLTSARKARP